MGMFIIAILAVVSLVAYLFVSNAPDRWEHLYTREGVAAVILSISRIALISVVSAVTGIGVRFVCVV